MKILYDHQIFTSQIFGGISRYYCELMNCFAKGNQVEFDLALYLSNNSYLQDASFANIMSFFPNIKFAGKTTIITNMNKWRSYRLLKNKEYDVFHPTNYDPYFLPLLGSKPFVVTVYDMIHELYHDIYPTLDMTREWKKLLVNKAAKVIAISENTKNDLIKVYNIDEDKIKVIYLASSIMPEKISSNKLILPEKYLLYVGDRKHYKKFYLLLSALAPIFKNDAVLALVCAGGGKLTGEEIFLLEKTGIAGKVYQYSVNDKLLAHLYQDAVAFVFPSAYEGFGIPVLEAFTSGCPVIVSRSSSLPEVAGDAAIYFDPHDEVSLREAVANVIYNQGLRDKLKRKGLEQAKTFSWEKTALETMAVYESVLK